MKGKGKAKRRSSESWEVKEVKTKTKSRLLVLFCAFAGATKADSYGRLYTIDLQTKHGYWAHAIRIDDDELNKKSGGSISCLHNGTSYVDLADTNQGWNGAAPPEYYKGYALPECVAFCGKIFVFGFISNTKVYDRILDRWDSVPPPPDFGNTDTFQVRVSSPPIADVGNSRILGHLLCGISSLYAYYPAQHHWELLFKDFELWSQFGVALHQGFLYMFHPYSNSVICAFGLASNNWLNVVLSSEFDHSIIQFEYDAFFHLGNGNFCLITYKSESLETPKTHVITVNFIAHRSTNDILVFPSSTYSYTIEDYIKYPRFVPSSFLEDNIEDEPSKCWALDPFLCGETYFMFN